MASSVVPGLKVGEGEDSIVGSLVKLLPPPVWDVPDEPQAVMANANIKLVVKVIVFFIFLPNDSAFIIIRSLTCASIVKKTIGIKVALGNVSESFCPTNLLGETKKLRFVSVSFI